MGKELTKMRIMVFDVPALKGGALSILEEYYQDAINCLDKTIEWYFVVGLPHLTETKNIKILRFPWVKKSWLHRIYFDQVIAPKLVKNNQIDKVISLQNMIIPNIKILQTLYVHQPLPFVDKKFKITESFLFWLYQNVVGKMIFKSIKKADSVIVQTSWMKEACIKKIKIDPEKIKIIPPKINIEIKSYFNKTGNSILTFFYPANASLYKNHKIIVDAVSLLKKKGINNYKVVFTLKGIENNHISSLYRMSNEKYLPIEFIGEINREQVFDYYTKSVLIFPSYIETFGLPLLEARLHNTPILASDCTFSREILRNYNNAFFFRTQDPVELTHLMEKLILK